MGVGWRSQHELIMCGTRENGMWSKYMGAQGNVITLRREPNLEHPTMKPVALLLFAPERPLRGVETGVSEGSPEVWSVAGQGVVETAGAQEPEVGHPEFAGGRHVLRRADPPAAQQVRCQAVDRLQHGQVETVWNAPLLCGFRRWFAVLAANPGSCTEEPHWDSKTGGHRKPARRSCFRRNPLNCCPGSPAENPGNRRAIRLLEPLIPTSWRSSVSPEWGSWSQYQKDSGAGRKSAISGHLGGWPMEGVFFSYGVWSSHSVGVLRKGFSSF